MAREYTELVGEIDRGELDFLSQEVAVDAGAAGDFLKLKINPKRFTSQVFEGDWAVSNAHPKLSVARLLRRIELEDGYVDILRQGDNLYGRIVKG